jgi:trans-aconitate 2-methyltransferase
MVEEIVATALIPSPRSVVDVGCGIGALMAALLVRRSDLQVWGLDPSPAMVRRARQTVGSGADGSTGRVQVVEGSVLGDVPWEQVDVVCSNLVLHNLRRPDKERAVARIRGWLSPGGWFVWGDLMAFEIDAIGSRALADRVAFAHDAGCDPVLVESNFRKEMEDDFPLTVHEAAGLARRAGFGRVDLVWAHDTFAVLVCGA